MQRTISRKEIGVSGEDVAAAYLKRKGYRILARNWSVRGKGSGKMLGELDIVARKGHDIVFVEVKAGSGGDDAYRPEMHVTPWKMTRLRRAAQVWLSQQKLLAAPWQIDVVAVDFPSEGVPRLRHIPHAVQDR